jgi:hypothetical protein
MILNKPVFRVSVLSAAMFLALPWILQSIAGAAPNRIRASQELSPSPDAKNANRLVQKPVDQDLDTLFARTKTDFDIMAASPVLKSPRLKPVNGFFRHSLKVHQPWHSLIRTDKKGAVINEVIRIKGESKEKRSVAGEVWFIQVSKTMKEHLNITKMEKTGRYYLVWAAPIVSKVKGTETFRGAVVAHIDLWDCFDRYSDKSTSPFKINILDRVVLYEHLWKDTIKYVKKPLTVPGIDKITVRYPGIGMTNEAAATRAADSAAIEQARLDSIRIKIAGDLAAKPAVPRKVKYHNLAIIAVVISGLLILVVALLVLIKNRGRAHGINTEKGKDRFGNL